MSKPKARVRLVGPAMTFDDADPDKPYVEPRAREPSPQDKKSTRAPHWLMNPASALFGGSSGSSSKKPQKSPPPAIRPTNRQGPPSSRASSSPPRASSPPPIGEYTNARAGSARLSSPPPQQPSVPSHRGGDSLASAARASASTSSSSYRGSQLDSQRDSQRSQGDPDEVKQALGELKRLAAEVRGLQASVVVLREEHGVLREELRNNKTASSGSLPVDDRVKLGGKQAPKGTSRNSAGFPGQEVQSKDLAMMEAPNRQETPPHGTRRGPTQTLPGGAAEEGGLLGGIWEACGFSDTKAIQNGSASASAPARQSSRAGSYGNAQRHLAVGQSADDGFSSAGVAPPLAPPSRPPPQQLVGAYTPGERREDILHSSAMRGNSPHSREKPMEARGNYVSSERRHPRSEQFDQAQLLVPPATEAGGAQSPGRSTPYFSSPRQNANELALFAPASADRQHSLDNDSSAPRFGSRPPTSTMEAAPQSSGSRPPSAAAGNLQLPSAPSAGLDNSRGSNFQKAALDNSRSSNFQQPAWRSPQVGGQLVLPFPDHEDEESGASSSPGQSRFATVTSSPGWEGAGQEAVSAPSPVPRLSLPTNHTPIAYGGGGSYTAPGPPDLFNNLS